MCVPCVTKAVHVLDGFWDVPLLVCIHHQEVVVSNLFSDSLGTHDVVFRVFRPNLHLKVAVAECEVPGESVVIRRSHTPTSACDARKRSMQAAPRAQHGGCDVD